MIALHRKRNGARSPRDLNSAPNGTGLGKRAMHRYLPGRSAPWLIASSRTRMSTGNAVDAALVARIAAGDRLAMQVLYTRHHARIRRFVLRFADEALADALVHEVFLHVWRNAGAFAGGGPVSTWLLCVARQKTIRAARSPDGHLRRQDATSIDAPASSESTEGRVP
jgi:hypothetical protein